MEPREGVEPTAYCLQSSCTTIVLSRQFGIGRVSLLHEDSIVAVDARWDTCPSKVGGEGGVRSPMSFQTSVFKTDAFADSATSPLVAQSGVEPESLGYEPCMLTITPPRD